jgi:glucosamine--fructose-6-phosphate aminotransferase (isomerizing)
MGGRTLSVTDAATTLPEADSTVAVESGLTEADRLVLYLPPLQLLAYHRAMAKGLDPDGPRNLTAVVTL